MKYRWSAASILFSVLAAFAGASSPPADVAELVKKLENEKDAAGPETLKALSDIHTREALTGLLDVYPYMDTLYMRREVLRALSTFDDIEGVGQSAMQKISDVATTDGARELREAALKLIGAAPKLGKHFLAAIIDSPADASVRTLAMELFIARYADEDFDFCLKLFRAADLDSGAKKKKAERQAEKGKPKEAEPTEYPVARVREIALEKIAPKMDVEELVTAATKMERDDKDVQRDGVRRIALAELDRRKEKRAIDIARNVYKDARERSPNRILAAQMLDREDGDKITSQFIDDGLKGSDVTPVDFRDTLADLVAPRLADAKSKPLIGKLDKFFTVKGKEGQKLFAIRALCKAGDEKMTKALAGLLNDTDPQVLIAVADALAKRGDKSVVPAIDRVLSTSKHAAVQGAMMDALGSLQAAEANWLKKLGEDTASKDVEVRNSALWQLAKLGQPRNFATFVKALDDPEWSTRLAAVKGLQILGSNEAISALIAHLGKEEGRMLHETSDALFHLTGQLLPPDQSAWQAWWDSQKTGFKGLGTGDFFKLKDEAETRSLKQATTTAFYGVRITSHRVIFIIDISGSMNEPMRSSYVGKVGESRIEVAKRELTKCIDGLDKNAFFNLISFSSGVDRWLDGGMAQSKDKDRTAAKTYVARLGANGGTNLYGALEFAFADKDVDTIYIMSDGEPNQGEVFDQAEIRNRVQQWNEHRKVVINTVAVGGSFNILEWLAQDSGGTHVKYD